MDGYQGMQAVRVKVWTNRQAPNLLEELRERGRAGVNGQIPDNDDRLLEAQKALYAKRHGQPIPEANLLTFGVYPGHFDAQPDKKTAPLLFLSVQRQIGQAGGAVFALPGLSQGAVGPAWIDLMEPGDFVQVEATVQRGPVHRDLIDVVYERNHGGRKSGREDPGGVLLQPWRSIFFGKIADMEQEDVPDGGGFSLITTVTCEDFLGSLDTPQFSYWRKLGTTFGAQGNLREKLDRLDRLNLGEADVTANSIAVSAKIVLESFIEGRIDIRRKVDNKYLDQKDTYGYRFESDDLRMGNLSLESLAPEAQSWKAALEDAVDGPMFYEMFQDSLPAGASKTLSPTKDGEIGRSSAAQARTREPAHTGAGGYGEYLIIRPAPFPTYRDEIDGDGNVTGRHFYSDAAWNALPIIEAAPFAHGNLRLKKTRHHLKSVFSVNINLRDFQDNSLTTEADANGQLVGDIHKLRCVTGYDPLDIPTKRTPGRVNGEMLSSPQLSRTLAWQLLSFNHLNDLYLNGTSSIPVDLRLQLGHRWREADYLFYIEGYKHTFMAEAATSEVTLSRGLPVEAYGLDPKARPKNKTMVDYVKKFLGRQRPGEADAPMAGQGIMSALNVDPKGGN